MAKNANTIKIPLQKSLGTILNSFKKTLDTQFTPSTKKSPVAGSIPLTKAWRTNTSMSPR